MNELGCDIKCRFEILSPENIELASQFDCGNEEINKYLRNESIRDDCGTSYMVIEAGTDTVLAYCTFCASGLTAEFEQSIRTIPAIEVKYFALSVKAERAVEQVKLIDHFDNPNQSKSPDSVYFGGRETPGKVQVHNVYQKVLQTYINFFKQGALLLF